MRVKSRRPSGNLLDMVDGDLRTVVAGALSRVVREGNVVACPDVPLMDDTGVRNHVVRLELVHKPRSDQSHVLVSLELMARADDATGLAAPATGQVSVAQASRERMQMV